MALSKEPAKLSCRVNLLHPESFLGQEFPAPLASISLVYAGVCRLNSMWTLRQSLFQPVQHFFQLCQQKNGHYKPNMTQLNTNKAEDTNYSSRETATEPSPPRKRSDRRIPFDDQWRESQWQTDRSRADLQKKIW